MATASHTSTTKSSSARKSTTAKKAGSTRSKDAIAVLKAQHREVEKLFGLFTKAKGDRQANLCRQICMELKVHTQIEEELLYPQAHDEINDPELVDESLVEHRAAKELIAQIEGTDQADEMFAARMQVLQEQIEHHVKEEETELFPKIRKSDMDLKRIGEQLQQRTSELKAEMKGDGRGRGMH
ncbi:MAG TPA: hemerythrin domain-containing protein [Phenylobacterium sp.]|uniref:hemerythrin domain-containing protein n=1 Tax=Phenylobacterium sp. TaxID=1871053 RepID=UPI002C7EEE59|nr:hemerythrin domain-containing protein [Phenylobacterium sp.]HSV04824.1 hemerythrin domain-containing protein [Phenylobacterium sp.]